MTPSHEESAASVVAKAGQRLPDGRRVFWIAFALLMVVTAAWSLASPLAAGPDESAHMVKAAAVVRGDLRGASSADDPGAGTVTVPALYAFTLSYPGCFAYHGDAPAGCAPAFPQGAAAETPVRADTWVIRNNPLYYAIVGLPTLLPAGEYTLYLMRLVSAALCSLILAWGIRSVAELTRRPMAVLGIVAALTPMVIFLNSTVNPSALEISAALTLWVSLLTMLRHPDPDRVRSRAAGIAVVAVVLANARGLSPFYVAVIVGCAVIASSVRAFRDAMSDRRTWPWLLFIGVGVAASLAWTLNAGTLESGGPPHPELGFVTTASRTFFDMGDFLMVSIGKFGWLDTDLPPLAYLVFAALIGFPTLLALGLAGRRDRLSMLGVLAVVVAVPVLVHAWQARNVGYIWTARYSMPLTVGVVVVAGFVSRDALASFPRWAAHRLMVTVTSLLAVGQLVALVVNLRRYTVGDEGSWHLMFGAPWSPPIPVAALLLVQVAAMAASVVLLTRFSRAGEPDLGSPGVPDLGIEDRAENGRPDRVAAS